MRSILYIFIILLITLTSCEKEDAEILSSKINLQEISIENGSLKLEWNRPFIQNFTHYAIYKTTEPYKEINANTYNVITHISDVENTVYYEGLFLDDRTYYTVVAFSEKNEPVVSNSQKHGQEGLVVFNESPHDIVFYPKNKSLFIFMENKIYSFNYESMEITDSIILDTTINYGSIGHYGDEDELYVSCSNGYLRIYNTDNLKEKDNIFTGGEVISALLDDYDNLYIKVGVYYTPSTKIYSYKRETLNLTDEFHKTYGNYGEIKHFVNSNRIVEVHHDDIVYYDHDSNGNITYSSNKNDYSYPKSQDIFEIFPNEDKIITYQSGAIYNNNLSYIAQIGESSYDYYNSIYINDYIYTARYFVKEIKLFSKTTYAFIETYETGLYPEYVYKDGNEIIIFGSNINGYYDVGNMKYGIGIIKLDSR